jgi:colanic acid/amylovoran/stewartan biosynthesis glycosyltransferase WcaL/AmsK/CpsK
VTVPQSARRLTVLQRCDQFVGRTTNWLYDHLRCIPRHVSLVLSDVLENRQEFPLLEARSRKKEHFSRRLWSRFMGDRPYPTEATWLRRCRPALLHSHFGYVALGDFGLRASLEVPWIVSFYGADVYELGRLELWRERYDRLFQQSNLVLALGPQMSAQLQLLGCPKEKMAVHPLGVDVDALPSCQRLLQRGACLEVLFAGTFREKKGIEYVIQGVAKARRAGVRLHLTLVGDAAQKPGDLATKESVFRQINSLKLNDVVTHHSYVKFDQLIQIALASHVFLAPSVTSVDGDAEGTPFVLQQMMATGMPVIATIHSDIPYIFGEHKHRLVPERNAYAIAERLEEYAQEPERLMLDGAALRERIRTAFDVRTCAATLSDIYDSLIARGRYTRSGWIAGIDERKSTLRGDSPASP